MSSWTREAREIEIEPSLYAADFRRLGGQIEELLDAGVHVFHFDVGDGHFVPPVTIGPIVLESIAADIHARGGLIDCHLMVEAPEHHFEQIAAAGGDSVTVHVEACRDVAAALSRARELGLGTGLALNPETAPERAAARADGADLVLCMSIHPGFSGQAFMPDALGRIARLRELLPDDLRIQVDGGVGPENARALVEAGATLLVAGTSIFGADDIGAAYSRLAEIARGGPTP